MNRIAFIVPTYPVHFAFAQKLEESFFACNLDKQADLYFVLTDESELEEWKKQGFCSLNILLSKEYRNFANRGIINIKKFYALSQLKDKYDYTIIIDSESEFIRDVDLQQICDEIFDHKQLFGNRLFLFQKIQFENIKNQCRSRFPKRDIGRLPTEDKDLYLWFNNLPVYRNADLDDFFAQIDYSAISDSLTFEDFDHYLYMYYLLLYKDFSIVDLQMFGYLAAGENIPEGFAFRWETRTPHDFVMCAKQSYLLLDNPKLFLLIHLDRGIRNLFSIIGNHLSKTISYEKDISLLKEKNASYEKDILLLKEQNQQFKNLFNQKSSLYKFFHFYWLRGKK